LEGQGRRKCDDIKAAARRDGLDWERVRKAAQDEGVSQERVKTFPSYTAWYIP
jgi:hypothetical protein